MQTTCQRRSRRCLAAGAPQGPVDCDLRQSDTSAQDAQHSAGRHELPVCLRNCYLAQRSDRVGSTATDSSGTTVGMSTGSLGMEMPDGSMGSRTGR
jgi:hypothetical protein